MTAVDTLIFVRTLPYVNAIHHTRDILLTGNICASLEVDSVPTLRHCFLFTNDICPETCSDSFIRQVFFKSSSSSTRSRNDWIAEGQVPITWARGDKRNSSSSMAFVLALALRVIQARASSSWRALFSCVIESNYGLSDQRSQ